MLSVDQLPAGYSSTMTSLQGAPWAGDVGGHYRRVAADRRSQSPPYPVSRGRVSGIGSLPSPSADSAVTAPSFGVGPPPTSSVYRVDTGRCCTPLHANLAIKVDTDNGSYI